LLEEISELVSDFIKEAETYFLNFLHKNAAKYRKYKEGNKQKFCHFMNVHPFQTARTSDPTAGCHRGDPAGGHSPLTLQEIGR
jgi:hypothetical protein